MNRMNLMFRGLLCLLLLVPLLPAPSDAAYDPVPQTAEDSAHVDLEKLIRLGCRRIDTAASSAGTSGDWATVDCASNGSLRVHIESSSVGSTSTDDDNALPSATANMSEVIDRMYAMNSDSASGVYTRFTHQLADYDSGGGTENLSLIGIALPASGGPVAGGTSTAPFNVAQNGTWTVQPGNTANTTPWLTTIQQGGNAATVNGSGQLSITCANCSGSGASFVDDAAFTVAVSSGAPAMGLFDDVSPDSIDEGDVGTIRMSANRNLYVRIRDNAGNERGLNVDANGAIAVTTALDPYGLNADAASATGSMSAKLRFIAATGIPITSLPGTVVEDAAETAGGTGFSVLNVRRDVAASSASTTAENATFNTDVLGLLWTRRLDPCSGVAKTHIPFSIVTATTTELTPSLAGASTHYYICSIDLVTAAANNVALVDDDSDGCGSVTSGLAGGVTAATGWNFAANGGLTKGSGDSTVFKTGGTNRVVCLMTSAAVQLSGSIQVVAAP